ncbi:hypothetical protein [Microbacterium dextranolyticum]|uniref:DUF3558 domain-containing protein n=1 Tax=Microbacterium dextranolyticum TaxID=36806 RepID=A0A9W6HQ27_9MICO|nr:hypothetical protein [Microbacterium dextranolyticum]MBM7463617.1 hypothetical protein [Microbacterium dextranolyticum]GLJ96553.1 hypothetical protein GCM10017591_26160 [Microbacterium dextranolyticum]
MIAPALRALSALGIVVVLGVTGCAATGSAADPAPSGQVTSSTPPSASATPSPTAAAWTVAFGGQCDAMLTPSQRDARVGPGALEQSVWLSQQLADVAGAETTTAPPGPEATAGGLRCTWFEKTDSSRTGRAWTVFALPRQVAAPTVTAALAEPACEWNYDTRVCRWGRTVGGLWVMVASSPMEEGEQAPVDVMSSLLDDVAANATAFPEPVPLAPTAPRWKITECTALGARMALEQVIGEGYWSGYWEGSRQPEDDLFEHAGVQQFCQFGPGDDAVTGGTYGLISVTLQPGGAWMWPTVSADAGDRTHLDGATDARLTVMTGSSFVGDRLVATDGTNLIRVRVGGREASLDVAGRALAALAHG